ncbi:MAG: CapA family protein [Pseudomonadota bacterium]|nr:CapA family protein [Pseudomonadota bacterium]
MGREGLAGAAAPLSVGLVGDVMLGRGVARAIEVYGVDHPLGAVTPLLADADVLFGNLECAFTQRVVHGDEGSGGTAYLRADPRHVDVLRRAGFDAVSLANNHVGDFGPVGILDTLAALGAAGIGHAGAGSDLTTAETPVRLVRCGWRVSMLAFADHPAAWAAGPSTPGIRYVSLDPAGLARARAAVTAERANADLLVVSLHVRLRAEGTRARPHPAVRSFARALVEAGADVVWGHGAHVVQGVEWVHDRPVIYDAGDVVDDYAADPQLRNDLGAVCLVRARRGGIDAVEVVPTRIRGMRSMPAEGVELARALARVASLCAELGTPSEVVGGRVRVPAPSPEMA